MKIAYLNKKFRDDSVVVIHQADKIIREYQKSGYSLTLRQLYYQFVARGLIENTEASYKRIGKIISDGRLAGLIDWDSIEDRTRNLVTQASWDSPSDILYACANQFSFDPWRGQDIVVEVWVEKEALAGVIERTCKPMHIPFFSCRGYVSQSEIWEAGQRIRRRWIEHDQETVILHLGDHDPSGIDMTRDNMDRLDMFTEEYSHTVMVNRIALNYDQIEKFNPPPNPAKMTDTRFRDYRAEYGESSWELDALDPRVIHELIVDTAEDYIDRDLMDKVIQETEEERGKLKKVADDWDEINLED